MPKCSIDSEGRLNLPREVVRSLGKNALRLVSNSPHHLLLTTTAEDGGGVLSGELCAIPVADILSFFNMFRKTGVLLLHLESGRKELFFQQGEIVFAASSFPEDELGEVLLQLGKVGRERLQLLRQAVSSDQSLSHLVVSHGLLTPRELWLASRYQVENIIYKLFGETSGGFVFICRELVGLKFDRFSLNTQNLIMEGLRRFDERSLFLRKIGSMDGQPKVAGEVPKDLGSAEKRMLQALTGGGTVSEVIRACGCGEFEGLQLLYTLIEKRLVRIAPPQPLAVDESLGELLTIFNGVLTLVTQEILKQDPQFLTEVRTFLRDLPHPYGHVLRDVTVNGEGRLGEDRVLRNLQGLDPLEQRRLLVDALNELVFMECLAARRELGHTVSAPLLQRVQEISRRVKQLIGRTE